MSSSLLEDSSLAIGYVISGTIYTITPQIAGHINATGVPGFQPHVFIHPFLLMAFEFLAQALCLGLWWIITGGRTPVTPPRLPNQMHQHERCAEQQDRPNMHQNDVEGHNDAAIGRRGNDNAGINGIAGRRNYIRRKNHLGDEEENESLLPGNVNIQEDLNDQDDPLLLDGNDPQHQHADNDQDDVPMLNPAQGDGNEIAHDQEGEEPTGPQRYFRNPHWGQPRPDQTKFKTWIFIFPALFDLFRYGLWFVAFKLIYSSSWILIRVAAVMFTVLLRVALLSKHMAKYMVASIICVMLGLASMGLTDFVYKTPTGYDNYALSAGCLLIIMSEIFIAMQFVFEEKFMEKHSIHPLRVIGLEGCFGVVISFIAVLTFSFIRAGQFSNLPHGHLEDVKDAFLQMKNNWIISLCVVGRIFSKVSYYYTGLWFVTNQHDSGKRICIDVFHSLIIWSIHLSAGWQNWFYPQIFGYVLVPLGSLIYCEVIPLPDFCKPAPVPRGDIMQAGQEQVQLNNHLVEERPHNPQDQENLIED